MLSVAFSHQFERFGIDHAQTPAFHPQSNGAVESVVHSMCNKWVGRWLDVGDGQSFTTDFPATEDIAPQSYLIRRWADWELNVRPLGSLVSNPHRYTTVANGVAYDKVLDLTGFMTQ